MSGVTKHIFEHDIRDIISMWNNQIKTIMNVLPKGYTNQDILETIKMFYPHEWDSVQFKYEYYLAKDKYLKSRFGKVRYNMKCPENLFLTVNNYKKITDNEYRKKYDQNYSDDRMQLALSNLEKNRRKKIEKINKKIEVALIKTQQVTPSYIEQLLGLYNRKNTEQKDKMYILLELKKYYCDLI